MMSCTHQSHMVPTTIVVVRAKAVNLNTNGPEAGGSSSHRTVYRCRPRCHAIVFFSCFIIWCHLAPTRWPPMSSKPSSSSSSKAKSDFVPTEVWSSVLLARNQIDMKPQCLIPARFGAHFFFSFSFSLQICCFSFGLRAIRY